MTPTTPSKPPVDTIREASDVLRRSLADPEGVTFHVRHGGDCRAWFQEPCSCSAQERFSEIMAALSALSSLSTQPAQTMMSTDYEALYEHLKAGIEPFCLVDYDWAGAKKPSRDVARVRRFKEWDIQIGARGIGYGQLMRMDKEIYTSEMEALKAECERMNLEWVAPLPAQTEGLEASVWIATIVYPNGDESHRYAATREAAAQLGHESTRVSGTVVSVLPAFARSLPRQKGEPVAWMTKDGRVDTLGVVNGKKSRNTGPEYFGPHWCIPLYK